MSEFIAPLESLIEGFARLPGVGRKSATRYALAVLDMNDEDVLAFADALLQNYSIHQRKLQAVDMLLSRRYNT